ncbi:MAG: 3-keto-5-aminohexanoate cleavage protein [Alphaproteobacteria bacterium]|nr:MAG: 3-keto-5-aminohexanoate cleavage protein [Alphaproteobacteria bacterium]
MSGAGQGAAPGAGRLAVLPPIMLAPNGARRTKADHPALPLTIAETVAAAAAGWRAGAGALHAHLRDAAGRHWLDAGAYRELAAELRRAVPGMALQITTEAAGRYGPEAQRALLEADTGADGASVALREILSDGETAATERALAAAAERGMAIQWILYDAGELDRLAMLLGTGLRAPAPLQLLFVLGSYGGEPARPEHLEPFLAALGRWREAGLAAPDWAACAFGPAETACLVAAARAGGKARVGFENNLHMADGRLAPDNAARVAELAAALARR